MEYGTKYTMYRICSTHRVKKNTIYGVWGDIGDKNAEYFNETVKFYNISYPIFTWFVEFQ